MESPVGLTTIDEQQLVSQARAGSLRAFSTLAERYYPNVLRFLIGATADEDLAHDLAQDTFMAALGNLEQLVEERTFEAWLFQIARNRWRSELRRRGRIRFLRLDALLAGSKSAITRLIQPDHAAIHAERDLLEQTLETLSPHLRESLLLNSVAGLTAREIADVLGISTSAAEKRVSRSYLAFRAQYEALVNGD